MFCDFKQLAHKGIQTLSPYVPGTSINEVIKDYGITDIIKLASNENPYGCSSKVIDAIKASTQENIAHYPSTYHHPLKTALAAMHGLTADSVMLSNGSDLFYTLLIMSFAVNSTKHILTHDYAFLTYSIQAKALGVPIVQVPLKINWEIDVDALINASKPDTALLFLANPSNPTGGYLNMDAIEHLLKHIPPTCICVLDQAYHEFVSHLEADKCLSLLKRFPNLFITRTFSKAYGLAGLRLGYALAHPNLIAVLQKIILPFSVSQIAMTAGLAALSDTDFVKNCVNANTNERARVREALENLNLTCLPANANFITIDTQSNSLKLYEALLKQGVIVRPLHAYGLANYLRISIGTSAENTKMLKALKTCINLI